MCQFKLTNLKWFEYSLTRVGLKLQSPWLKSAIKHTRFDLTLPISFWSPASASPVTHTVPFAFPEPNSQLNWATVAYIFDITTIQVSIEWGCTRQKDRNHTWEGQSNVSASSYAVVECISRNLSSERTWKVVYSDKVNFRQTSGNSQVICPQINRSLCELCFLIHNARRQLQLGCPTPRLAKLSCAQSDRQFEKMSSRLT